MPVNLGHYARDAYQNLLNIFHQLCTWPLQCTICSNPALAHTLSRLFFAPTVDSDEHFVCCMPVDPPEPFPVDNDMEIDSTPIIFTVIGQIAPEECYLTAQGDQRAARPDHSRSGPLASCWLESRPDRASCLEWRQIPSAIARVASAAVGPVNTSRVLRFMPNDGAVQLRVRFAPRDGELRDTLPFFNNEWNARVIPETLKEVPFNTPIRAMFTLEYVYEGDERFLFADLFSLDNV
ncbi:hypothetical protein BV20DRAFT_1098068 [Pilatotrama ljubarskyi]|nr:hypothetical protein BV20DRAFT_1098068 [Pilatotrama ljubarskyi]